MSAAQPIPQDDICSICSDPKPQGEPKIICYGNDICLECLRVIVTRVVNDKDQYPVKLDHKTVFDYSGHLDASLLEQYKLKGLEHSTFPADRVFCYCGKFIGRLIVHREGEEYIAVKTCSDTNCQRFSCLNCATQLESLPDIIDHGCKETRQAKEEDKQKMFESKDAAPSSSSAPTALALFSSRRLAITSNAPAAPSSATSAARRPANAAATGARAAVLVILRNLLDSLPLAQ